MAQEELEKEKLRAIGLGYNYSALQEQVKTVLFEACQKVLPFDLHESEPWLGLPSRTTSRPRYSMDTTHGIQLDKALNSLTREQNLTTAAVAKVEDTVQKCGAVSDLVDLYALTLEVIKTTLEAGPNPSEAPPAAAPVKSTVVKASTGDSVALRRLTVAPQTSLPGWKQAANNAIGQNQRNKTTKSRAPPPKPIPRPVTEEEFESVSIMVRGRAKLEAVNKAYDVLYDAFCNENMEKIKLTEVAKRGISVSGMTEKAKLKILRSLKRINISADENFISPGDCLHD